MYERVLSVKYITCKDCFCYLSQNHFKHIQHGTVLQLIQDDGYSYLSLGPPFGNLSDNEIGINSLYAKALCIKENETIVVRSYENVPAIQILTISTLTKDDYNIVELLAENIELTLLNQIRILNSNQKFVIWISNSLNVTVIVDCIEPASPGCLHNFTQVVVKEPIVHKQPEREKRSWNYKNFFSNYFYNEIIETNVLKSCHNTLSMPLIFRLLPVQKFGISQHLTQPFNVFVKQSSLPKMITDMNPNELNLFKATLLKQSENEEASSVKSVIVSLFVLDDLIPNKNLEHLNNAILVSDYVLNHFVTNVGSKVILEKVNMDDNIDAFEVCVDNKHVDNAAQDFKEYLANNCKEGRLLLNSHVIFKIKDYNIYLKFEDEKKTYCVFDDDLVRSCKITVYETVIINNKHDGHKEFGFLNNLPYIKYIIERSLQCYEVDLNSKRKLENILIVGKPGSGKTTLLKNLGYTLSQHPFYIYLETIYCKNIKGKTIESLYKILTTVFSKLIYYQPSILLIEDIHVICSEGEDQLQEMLYFNKVSEMLTELFDNYLTRNKISVIATCESTFKLNRLLYSSRGKHIFKNVFSIDELSKTDRKAFLTFLFAEKCDLENVDLDAMSVKTEGFVVQDIIDFTDKAVYEMYKSETEKVTTDHCEAALKNTSALSLRDVKFNSSGNRNLSDVGGLEDVKTILIESMLWPVQFPNVFGKSPLRLQSGLLLYGPPGTGKTILAGAAAKHCGLRLISIKGPELLSKYVGASEQAVRNVFQKAQSAKPCILFFDEFDSLASRRGHDNTGVTDRVVNQFLTQLDGIESLSGVCVLAATSRPDLLDPALLRPGRLDKQILCPLPDKSSRMAILEALSKPLTLSEDVDFVKLVEKTEGFSGADLQSVLYTAQLSSVEHLLGTNEESQLDFVVVNQNHLEEAVRNTRPSLTMKERLKYERIYAKFRGGVDIDDFMSSQRATLA